MFATTYVFGLLGLLVNILGDFTYTLVDPRLDFETRDV
jgi:microcin C transport system permease protein